VFEDYAREKLTKKSQKDYLRKLDLSTGSDFSSNDYLGFARSGEVLENYKKKVQALNQLGSTGSRLLSGNHEYHRETENRIAKIFRSESSLVFSSGYLLNIGLIQCIADDSCILLIDELCHNSFKAGAKASKAKSFFFRHNDMKHLRERLQRHSGQRCFILVESVYSMDGDLSPLNEIVQMAEEFGAEILVDEAHAVGVIGNDGLGLVATLGLEKRILARVITFGKALGAEGAAILGSDTLIKYMINFCQTFIYTTGLSFPLLLMINTTLDMFTHSQKEIQKLHANLDLFSKLTGLKCYTPIIPWMTEGRKKTIHLSEYLNNEGFKVFPIFSPTIQRGKERIRIIIHSHNSESEILNLITHIT
jgi:8-amino-7-oxononanoate synthase